MLERAAFGAGCFWGVQAAFSEIKGVKSTAVGFMGGTVKNPSYREVCAGGTGHAEVVSLEYDPSEVSYNDLLAEFWGMHNPTSLNRQGFDVGEQYRSVIFYYTKEQKEAALASKELLENNKQFAGLIVTQIVPAKEFYRAEEYHQEYYAKQGLKGHSCHIAHH